MTERPIVRRFTRQELYDLVWFKPIRTIAPDYGISDVAFAKTCRGHDIPLPPRGYWARQQAGKKVAQEALPPREIGMSETIEVGGGAYSSGYYGDPPGLITMEIPPPPEFAEPIADIKQRMAAKIGKVTIPRNFEKAHRLIAGLLAEDEARRQKQIETKYPSIFDAPRYDSPFERRRLRLLSAIFVALEKAGYRPSMTGKDPTGFHVRVGGQSVAFTLEHPGQQRDGYRPASAANRPASDKLKCEISAWRKTDELALLWQDKGEDLVERHIDEIVVTLIVAGELQYRQGEVERAEQLKARKAQLIEEARKRREEEERRERERRIKAEQARVDRLLGEADALRHAQAIRAYVEQVRALSSPASQPLAAEKIEAWASWALAQADRIDPVVTGRFLEYQAVGEPMAVQLRKPHCAIDDGIKG